MLDLKKCPKCGMRVMPRENGCCPSCQASLMAVAVEAPAPMVDCSKVGGATQRPKRSTTQRTDFEPMSWKSFGTHLIGLTIAGLVFGVLDSRFHFVSPGSTPAAREAKKNLEEQERLMNRPSLEESYSQRWDMFRRQEPEKGHGSDHSKPIAEQ
jgi:hypothetical protein